MDAMLPLLNGASISFNPISLFVAFFMWRIYVKVAAMDKTVAVMENTIKSLHEGQIEIKHTMALQHETNVRNFVPRRRAPDPEIM